MTLGHGTILDQEHLFVSLGDGGLKNEVQILREGVREATSQGRD
jgi:hypothetical protein